MVCQPDSSWSIRELPILCERIRRSIGQEIHDQVAQLLTSIAIKSDLLDVDLRARRVPAAVQAGEIANIARQTQDQLRKLVQGLTAVTLHTRGFKTALEELLQLTESIFLVRCSLNYEVVREVEDREIDLHLYRIAQEAIHNAVKHGKASSIHLGFKATQDKIRLSILDDGCGIPRSGPSRSGLGLHTMRVRAQAIGGTLTIRRRRDRGTQVIFATSAPLPLAVGLGR